MGISDVFTICLVSEWMEQGTICSFLSRQRDEPRAKYVCTISPRSTKDLTILQLIDIVNGLSHMHSLEVVHGDLKAVIRLSKSRAYRNDGMPQANILIDNQLRARISDFGLATVMYSTAGHTTTTLGTGGTVRWMAPELFEGDPKDSTAGQPTFASDVYALAMTCWEVCYSYCLI
jgi:serine/threonine protein kinase